MKLLTAFLLCFSVSSICLACDINAAKSVNSNLKILATLGQEAGHKTVRWGPEFFKWPKDQQLYMAQIAANSDACLYGKANEIRFYSPSGKLNAVASPTTGIRLID